MKFTQWAMGTGLALAIGVAGAHAQTDFGLGATANAVVMNGAVVDAILTDGGSGYTNTPIVRIFEGGGSGAQAVAVVSNGIVTAVQITNGGSGYTNPPVIVIAPPFIEQPVIGISVVSVLSFSNLVPGTNYQLQAFTARTWANIGAAFTASSSTFTQQVAGAAGARSYRLAVSPIPTQAYATAQVFNGYVIGATVTSGGSGYTTNPAVTISGGGGSNAIAVAYVSGGIVTDVTVIVTGVGYTNTPSIAIAPPPVNALWPVVTQIMKLDLSRLSPYENYQMEFSPLLGTPWDVLPAPFIPTATTDTLYLNLIDASILSATGFFRAAHVP